jgi:hypothetical protein
MILSHFFFTMITIHFALCQNLNNKIRTGNDGVSLQRKGANIYFTGLVFLQKAGFQEKVKQKTSREEIGFVVNRRSLDGSKTMKSAYIYYIVCTNMTAINLAQNLNKKTQNLNGQYGMS